MTTYASSWQQYTSSHSVEYLVGFVPFLIVVLTYWAFGLVHLMLDVTRSPYSLYRYKFQKKMHFEISNLSKLIRVVLLNHCFLAPISYILSQVTAHGGKHIGIRVVDSLPTTAELLGYLIGFGLVQETIFYYTHRLLHWGWLYTAFHKVHHEYKAPVALAATYAHPVEFVFQNILPLVLPPVLFSAPLAVYYTQCFVAVIVTQAGHAGYDFPWLHLLGPLHRPDFHDFHHQNFSGNYGVTGLLDYLHGTDSHYWRHIAVLEKEKKAKAK